MGEEALEVIKAETKATLIYTQAYFYWIVCGEVYSYRDVRNNDLYKKILNISTY